MFKSFLPFGKYQKKASSEEYNNHAGLDSTEALDIRPQNLGGNHKRRIASGDKSIVVTGAIQ